MPAHARSITSRVARPRPQCQTSRFQSSGRAAFPPDDRQPYWTFAPDAGRAGATCFARCGIKLAWPSSTDKTVEGVRVAHKTTTSTMNFWCFNTYYSRLTDNLYGARLRHPVFSLMHIKRSTNKVASQILSHCTGCVEYVPPFLFFICRAWPVWWRAPCLLQGIYSEIQAILLHFIFHILICRAWPVIWRAPVTKRHRKWARNNFPLLSGETFIFFTHTWGSMRPG